MSRERAVRGVRRGEVPGATLAFVTSPEDDQPQAGESVWARLEREDGRDAQQAAKPLALMWTGCFLLITPTWARILGFDDVPTGVIAVVVALGLAFGVTGFVLYRSVRRQSE